MSHHFRHIVTWSTVAFVAIGILSTTLIVVHKKRRITLAGAVLRQDPDPGKQLPLADVQVTAIMGGTVGDAKSDSSGLFSLKLPKGFRRRQPVTLQFRHSGYRPLDIGEYVSDKLYIARMEPAARSMPQPHAESDGPPATISNVRIRYSIKTTTEPEVGGAVKTLQVVNTGNVPCHRQYPCSPDGRWKASIGAASLDAGEGNQFRNARVSCIAGPCPFTRIDLEDISDNDRTLNVVARNWSDTTTFLLEAEVVHPMVSDIVRESYPMVFGRALNFSLPAAAEGLSIEADISGDAVIFPLGPDLFLSWAQCTQGLNKDQTRFYRCELRPGYRFR
jgi:hypothetical protein